MVELVIIIGLRINMFSSPTFLRVKLLILNTVIIQVIIELGGMLFGVSGLLLSAPNPCLYYISLFVYDSFKILPPPQQMSKCMNKCEQKLCGHWTLQQMSGQM